MADRNVTAAAQHFDAQEAASERACAAAATAHGLTADQAEQCDDGDQGCPTCPWRKPPARYVRKPDADKRVARGDDFAGDAWLDTQTGETVYTVVGFDRNQQPTMIVQDGLAVSTAGVQEVPCG